MPELTYLEAINAALQQGYAVAVSDYQGLGTPGPHTYMVGQSMGRAVLDMARHLDLSVVAEGVEKIGQGRGVLASEQVGGREERGLPTRVDRRKHGPQRDDRLAGTDLTL